MLFKFHAPDIWSKNKYNQSGRYSFIVARKRLILIIRGLLYIKLLRYANRKFFFFNKSYIAEKKKTYRILAGIEFRDNEK